MGEAWDQSQTMRVGLARRRVHRRAAADRERERERERQRDRETERDVGREKSGDTIPYACRRLFRNNVPFFCFCFFSFRERDPRVGAVLSVVSCVSSFRTKQMLLTRVFFFSRRASYILSYLYQSTIII